MAQSGPRIHDKKSKKAVFSSPQGLDSQAGSMLNSRIDSEKRPQRALDRVFRCWAFASVLQQENRF